MQFRNLEGQPIVTMRSFQMTHQEEKKTGFKLTAKQLEACITTTDAEVRKCSINNKCAEMNTQVPELMGVSKAVLEYVIFCHQEDSCWPLMASSVVKARFDELFGATRYTKALGRSRRPRRT